MQVGLQRLSHILMKLAYLYSFIYLFIFSLSLWCPCTYVGPIHLLFHAESFVTVSTLDNVPATLEGLSFGKAISQTITQGSPTVAQGCYL